MRLAYLLKKFPSLSESFVTTEILEQEALGAEVHIFSRQARDDEPRHPELDHLEATVEVFPRLGELHPWGMALAAGSEGPRTFERSRLRSIVHERSPMIGERFPLLIAEALHFRRRALELSIEHVHVHSDLESAVVAMLANELGGPSYSLTAHAVDIDHDEVGPDLLESLILGSTFLVAVCDAMVVDLRARISPEAATRIRRLYNGLSLERFPYREIGRNPEHILSAGQLVEERGFGALVAAFAELKRQGRPFMATLVGSGEDKQKLKALAKDMGLNAETIMFTGAIGPIALRALMRDATMFCLPCAVSSDGKRDALPTVLLEALAMGLPCISTPVLGIPEILDHGRAGRLVPDRDPAALVETISELMDDPAQRLNIARRGRRRAEQLFDARRSGEALHGWFQSVLPVSAEWSG